MKSADALGDVKLHSIAKCFNFASKVWSGFAAFSMMVFWILSSQDFSFLLTLSSLVSMFSFFMLAVMIWNKKSVEGVSLKMMECYIIIFFCRLCAIVPFEGYLPLDKSGDWFYQTVEGLAFCLSLVVVGCCRWRYAGTYKSDTDTMNRLWLLLPVLALTSLFHANLNSHLPTDLSWTFALYLESVAVMPQLFLFMNEKRTQSHISHFLAGQALSRVLSFCFWAPSFTEIADSEHHLNKYAGHWVMAAQAMQLLVMGDFIYHYIRCIRKGIPLSEMLSCAEMV